MTIAPRKEDHVSVSTACLDLSEIAAMVADPRAGAISTFSGTTRDNHFGERSHRGRGEAANERDKAMLPFFCVEVQNRLTRVSNLPMAQEVFWRFGRALCSLSLAPPLRHVELR